MVYTFLGGEHQVKNEPSYGDILQSIVRIKFLI